MMHADPTKFILPYLQSSHKIHQVDPTMLIHLQTKSLWKMPKDACHGPSYLLYFSIVH
jgi:hypothetical protein